MNRAILSKSDWILKQIKKSAAVGSEPGNTWSTGEVLLFKGKRYQLCVICQNTGPGVHVRKEQCIDLVVKPGSNVNDREKIIERWYRQELKHAIEKSIEKWQPRIGVKVNEFGVKKMRTRWGSCNIKAKRIWLNLALIKLTPVFLEYVIVHEMVHLLERKHNDRFKGFMDQFIPEWRGLKKELDSFRL